MTAGRRTDHAGTPRPIQRKPVAFGRNKTEETQPLEHMRLGGLPVLPIAPGGFVLVSGNTALIPPGSIFMVPIEMWSGSPPYIHQLRWVEQVSAHAFEKALHEIADPPQSDVAIYNQVIGFLLNASHPGKHPALVLADICEALQVPNLWEGAAPDGLPVPPEVQPPWTHMYRGKPARLLEQLGPDPEDSEAPPKVHIQVWMSVGIKKPDADTAEVIDDRVVGLATWENAAEALSEEQFAKLNPMAALAASSPSEENVVRDHVASEEASLAAQQTDPTATQPAGEAEGDHVPAEGAETPPEQPAEGAEQPLTTK